MDLQVDVTRPMSTGPPNDVSQTTANCCPSDKVTRVPLRPGQLAGSRVGKALASAPVADAPVVEVVDGMVTFARTDIEVTERAGGEVNTDAFTGYCEKPVETMEGARLVKLADTVGVKLGTEKVVELSVDGTMVVKLGTEKVVELSVDGMMGVKLGTEKVVEFSVGGTMGVKLGTEKVVEFSVGGTMGVKLGTEKEVELSVGGTMGVKLGTGTEKEVVLSDGSTVDAARDEGRVFERVSEELKPGADGKPLEIPVATLIDVVMSGIVTAVSVLGRGVGSTGTVEETVTVAGGLPALVRIRVLVPVVTITVLKSVIVKAETAFFDIVFTLNEVATFHSRLVRPAEDSSTQEKNNNNASSEQERWRHA
ncbi:MAG: hypothetical protein LQ345_001143 [Seirophora villosa]|nr:MAG: hypothetical protein LQ345_001143 [Seirophora villosa]